MLLDELAAIVGERAIKTSPEAVHPHVTEWRGQVEGKAAAVVQPASTQEVAAVMRHCFENSIGVVPQGGNTGLCAGAVPDESGTQIVLSLSRLNRVRSIDADDFSLVAEAGCVLSDIQDAARAAGRLFPLSLAAEGSCQIGGNLATNAGGINVLRYGTSRSQVLGLEVVLADGRLWSDLRTLRKNTAGYDLKQLFIGSEGTLGVITAASLKLYPQPADTQTALVTIDDARDAVPLLASLRETLADQVQAFELISAVAYDYVLRHIDGTRSPFARPSPWYVLIETTAATTNAVEEALMRVLEAELVREVAVAKSAAESAELWRLRHSIPEAEKHEAPILKHDISVPVGRMAEFLDRSRAELSASWPAATLVAFGHVGDGNLHYNVALPKDWNAERRAVEGARITRSVYALAEDFGGSFSAEHGVGRTKRDILEALGDPAALDMMRVIKTALDPRGILNPGKVI